MRVCLGRLIPVVRAHIVCERACMLLFYECMFLRFLCVLACVIYVYVCFYVIACVRA